MDALVVCRAPPSNGVLMQPVTQASERYATWGTAMEGSDVGRRDDTPTASCTDNCGRRDRWFAGRKVDPMPGETMVDALVPGVSLLPACSGGPPNAPLGRLSLTASERLKTAASGDVTCRERPAPLASVWYRPFTLTKPHGACQDAHTGSLTDPPSRR